MRIFWAIIAVLAIVTIVVVMANSARDELQSVSRRDVSPTAPVSVGTAPVDSNAADLAREESTESSSAAQPAIDLETQASALIDDLLDPSLRAEHGSQTPANQEHGFKSSSSRTTTADAEPTAEEATAGGELDEPVFEAQTPDHLNVKAGSAVAQPDGSTLLDGQYVIRGSGSADDPYQITWDLLVSASETYQPRLGMTDLPQRVMMLNGKHVKITGYIAFPLAQMESKEILVMLNLWDGCCIGVPPSPYDAIEVKLTEPLVFGNRRFLNYATLKGVLKVDPYLQNEWLLGLYLVENGALDFGM